MSNAFTALEKAMASFSQASEASSQRSRKNTEKEIQAEETLLGKRKALRQAMEDIFNKSNGKLTDAQKGELRDLQNEYQKLIRIIAQMKVSTGDVGSVQGLYRTVFMELKQLNDEARKTNLGELFGKGIEKARREYRSFLNDLYVVQSRMKADELKAKNSNEVRHENKFNGTTDRLAKEKAEKEQKKADEQELKALESKAKKFSALQAQMENLMYRVNQHKDSGLGLVYTEKEYARDVRHFEDIIRRMQRLAMTKGDLGALKSLYNSQDLFADVLRGNGNKQTKESKEKAEFLKAIQKELNNIERSENSIKKHSDEGLIYTKSAFANDHFRIQQALAMLTALKASTTDPNFLKQITDGIARGGISRQNAIDLFNNSNKQVKSQKDEVESAKQAEQRLKNLATLSQEMQKLLSTINSHRGLNGKFYTNEEWLSDKKHLQDIIKQFNALNATNIGRIYSPDRIMNGANIKQYDLSNMLSNAKDRAHQCYIEFAKTRSEADRIRLYGAVNEMRLLESASRKEEQSLKRMVSDAEKFRKAIQNLLDGIEHHMKRQFLHNIAENVLNVPTDVFMSFRELEQAMAGVKQVIPMIEHDQAKANLELQQFIEIAHDYARTSKEVVEAGQLWGRGYGKKEVASGLSEEVKQGLRNEGKSDQEIRDLDNQTKSLNALKTTNELVRQSAILATVDNFSMAESVKGLEAILSAYNARARTSAEATLFAGRAVDILSKVAHNGQISCQDLVQGIEVTGKASQQAGISLEFLSAMIETGVRNTGLSGSNIGNAVKALSVGIHTDKAVKLLKDFGVQVDKIGTDGVRRMRPVQEVLLDISRALQQGDKNAEKMLLAISGGRMQYSKISAILRDETELIRMWGIASNSAGFAQEQLAVQMNTINSKLKQTKTHLESLMTTLMSDGGDSVIKRMIEGINTILKLLNNNSGVISTGLPVVLGMMMLSKAVMGTYHAYQALRQAQIAEMGIASRGTRASLLRYTADKTRQLITEGLTASTIKAKNAEIASTTATKAGTTARSASTTATTASTVANGAYATSLRTVEGAMAGVVAMETIMSVGLNLAIGAIVAFVASFVMAGEEVKKVNVDLAKNTQLTNENIESAEEQADLLKQKMSAYEAEEDWIEKAIPYMEKLKASIDSGTLSQKENEEQIKKLSEVQATFDDMVARSAESTEEKNNIINKSNAEKARFMKEKYDFQKSVLQDYQNSYQNFVLNDIEWSKKVAQARESDIEAFTSWSSMQLEGLGLLQKAWIHTMQIIAGIAHKMSETLANNKYFQEEKNSNSSIGRKYKLIEDFVNGVENNATWLGTKADFGGLVNSLETQKSNALKKMHDSQGKLLSLSQGVQLSRGLYTEEGYDYGTLPDPVDKGGGSGGSGGSGSGGSSGGTGSTKKQKIYAGNDEKTKSYHNAIETLPALKDNGINEFALMALADRLSNNNEKAVNGDRYGLFQITQGIFDKYAKGEDILSASSNIRASAMYLNECLGGSSSKIEGFTKFVGGNVDEARSLIDAMEKGAEAYEQTYKFDTSDSGYIYEDVVTNSIQDGLNAGIDRFLGTTTDLHGIGCVEAVEKIGSWYSQFLSEEFDAGVRSVPKIIDDALQKGIKVLDYDASELEIGDCVVWANNGDKNNHIGIYIGEENGQKMVVDNSSSKDMIVKRPLDRSWQNNQSIIKTGAGGKPISKWGKAIDSEKKVTFGNLHYSPQQIDHAYWEDEYARQKKNYEYREAEINRREEYGGVTANTASARVKLQEDKINDFKKDLEIQIAIGKENHAELLSFVSHSSAISEWLKSLGNGKYTWQDLGKEQQLKAVEALKNQNPSEGKILEKLVKTDHSFEFDKKGDSVVLKSLESQLRQSNVELAKLNGHKTPKEQFEYNLKRNDEDKRLAMAEASDIAGYRDIGREYFVEKQFYEAKIAEYENEQKRVQKELNALRAKDKLKIASQKEKIANLNSQIAETSKNNANSEHLDALQEQLDNAMQTLADLEKNGSSETQNLLSELNDVSLAMREAQQEMTKMGQEVKQDMCDTITDGLDSIILKGEDASDVLKNLRNELASYALKQIVYSAFGSGTVAPSSSANGILSIFGGGTKGTSRGKSTAIGKSGKMMSTGGQIRCFSNGGYTAMSSGTYFNSLAKFASGGYTNGIVRGAGNGTSDSILTYLENKGQFIKTSNGEYIVQQKAVDTLGVGFLDTLNNSPELFAGLKRYASGGSLGDEYEPQMTPKAINSYNNFVSNKANIKDSSNRRLESAMKKQTNAISSIAQRQKENKLVVMNTHASGEDILKAIKDNPRTIQKILGKQEKNGF